MSGHLRAGAVCQVVTGGRQGIEKDVEHRVEVARHERKSGQKQRLPHAAVTLIPLHPRAVAVENPDLDRSRPPGVHSVHHTSDDLHRGLVATNPDPDRLTEVVQNEVAVFVDGWLMAFVSLQTVPPLWGYLR